MFQLTSVDTSPFPLGSVDNPTLDQIKKMTRRKTVIITYEELTQNGRGPLKTNQLRGTVRDVVHRIQGNPFTVDVIKVNGKFLSYKPLPPHINIDYELGFYEFIKLKIKNISTVEYLITSQLTHLPTGLCTIVSQYHDGDFAPTEQIAMETPIAAPATTTTSRCTQSVALIASVTLTALTAIFIAINR